MLIDRGTKMVTREEIRKQLWPNDTVVDFDHGINMAIGVLRRALGDSADNPQYIETLARRGYRLLVTPERLETTTETVRGGAASPQRLPVLGGLVGKKVSHYRVLEVIGGGGMGMVYKAEDLKLGRQVAVKFLPEELASDRVALQRFEREAQTASALNHANICTIHQIAEYEGQPFIVMELLEGSTLLHQLSLSESKAIPLVPLLEIALQICDGLQAAHDKGIIHRDIKPANICLTNQGPVKILDFGLAKLASTEEVEEMGPQERADTSTSAGSKEPSRETGTETPKGLHTNLTHTGIAIGTTGYMSPEQVRKEKLDARTDLFSFGLVLYEMAAGRRAFTGETAAVVHNANLTQTPAAGHHLQFAVPRGLHAVIAKALENDRSQRYQSAAEMREEIEQVRREMRPVRRFRNWLASAALLIVVAGGAWVYRDYRNKVKLSPSDTVVLAVSNQTGDPVFDDALNLAVRVGLEQTPYLNVLADNKVRGTLSTLKVSEDAKVTPEIAREVCLRTNSKMVVASSIADAGNGLRIELKGTDCQSGVTVARVRQDAASRNEVVHLLGVSAAELRGKLGEPAASIAKFNKPLELGTSASLEALQLLTEGYRHHLAGDFRGALP